ncbi:MAG TPA: M20 family metallopeptidase [Ktedonobacteraceae bacterium]|jgi:glutamate carboxypeptidase|nr:M20 family metallopeptidase [Ktedonobacteraceae bacterium]
MSRRNPYLAESEQVMDAFLADLKAIVNIDSGTFTKAGIDRVGAYLQERFTDFGFSTSFDRQTEYGNHLVATRSGSTPTGAKLLLIGHIDTVFPEGEAERRPFATREEKGRRIATGPGVLDMKSGVLMGIYALHLLNSAHEDNYAEAVFICNSDEEIGSPSSRPLIRQLAQQADAVLVLEPGRAEGTVVSSRRGCGQYRVEVHGVSAHAGVEPDKGRNAILELSYQVQKMQALNSTVPGATLSVGIIRGGDRTNVVPDYAYFDMDVRAADAAAHDALYAAMQRVVTQHHLKDTRITLSGSMLCQPFERNKNNEQLVKLVKEAGSELGISIHDVGSGGASDANTTAAMGIPTLDGLGAGGGLAHNPGEYIELDYLPKRIALIANLIRKIQPRYG